MVLYSRSAEYAVRAIAYVALLPKGQRCNVRDIAAQEHLPAFELAKILQGFVRMGVLSSSAGRNGGFALRVDPRKIRLIDIVERVDGPALFQQCQTRLKTCSGSAPCPLHNSWTRLRSRLESMTVAEIAAVLRKRHTAGAAGAAR